MQKRKKSRRSVGSFKTKMFFVTVLKLDEKDPKYLVRSHCLGFYETFKRAEQCVLKNEGDMYELNHYNHAVIEKYGQGIYYYCDARDSHWYRVTYKKGRDQFKPMVKKISKPKKLEKIVNFAM